jgi:hypothetical protein
MFGKLIKEVIQEDRMGEFMKTPNVVYDIDSTIHSTDRQGRS